MRDRKVLQAALAAAVVAVWARCEGSPSYGGGGDPRDECGSHSDYDSREERCVCDDGYDWCSDDPDDFDCCSTGSGSQCGDGTCDSDETASTCPADCPASQTCGNGVCDRGETSSTCPADCPPPRSEVCDNRFDDDGDGWADCDDSDCDDAAACRVPLDEDCDNGRDDDQDGDADCDDSDCEDACAPPPVENCADGRDNDADGDVDCDDPDCEYDDECFVPWEICWNGVDDDDDGWADCDDADCEGDGDCQASGCWDGEMTDLCTGSNICYEGECASAFGRTWTFTVDEGEVPPFTSGGAGWDPDGSAPDPLVVISLDGVTIGSSSYCSDSLTCAWYFSADGTVLAGSLLTVEVWDYDTFDPNDPIFYCDILLSAETLRTRGTACSGISQYLSLYWWPL